MSDSGIDRRSKGFAELAADVLSADAVELDLLLRYARESSSLSAVERERVEAYLAASPAHRDRLAVMLRMAEAAASAGGIRALAEGDEGPGEGGSAGAEVIPLTLARRPGAWMALAASIAVVLMGVWLLGPVGSDAPEQIAGGDGPGTEAPEPGPLAPSVDPAPEVPVDPGAIAEAPGEAPSPAPERVAPAPRVRIAESSPATEPSRELPPEPAPLAPGPPSAEPVGRGEPIVIAALLDAGPLRYNAPPGFDALVRVDGSARSSDASPLRVRALAPRHTGLTAKASPTLYWFVSRDADAAQALSLMPADGVEPLVELRVAETTRAGVQRIDLAEHGVVLEPGIDYQWSVALIPDASRRGRDVVAAAEVRRIVDADVTARVAAAPAAERGHVLAAAGIWYDALDFLSREIARHPEERALHERRAELLAQVGLADVAAWERAAPAR
jgi:hypothetical protein